VGIRAAVDHLVALGHVRIAHVTGPEDQASILERRDAFLTRMLELGLPVPDSYVSVGGAGTVRERTAALVRRGDAPTAVIAWNDGVAVDVIAGATDAGLSVPEDLSVVGFDDDSRAAAARPPLTTLRHPVRDICRAGTLLLVDRIEGRATPSPERWVPELVVRDSTAVPRSQTSGKAVS